MVVCESNANNIIGVEVSLENLGRALRSGWESTDFVMRLSKSAGYPVLSFTINYGNNVVQHMVRCRLMPPNAWLSVREPVLPDPEVHIIMPSAQHVRSVSERFRNLSDRLTILANMAGQFGIAVATDEVSAETRWSGLINPELNPERMEGAEPHASHARVREKFIGLSVDARDWINLLRVHILARRIIACKAAACMGTVSLIRQAGATITLSCSTST